MMYDLASGGNYHILVVHDGSVCSVGLRGVKWIDETQIGRDQFQALQVGLNRLKPLHRYHHCCVVSLI